MTKRSDTGWIYTDDLPTQVPPNQLARRQPASITTPNTDLRLQLGEWKLSAHGSVALISVSLAATALYCIQQCCRVGQCIVRRLNTIPRAAGDQR